MCEAPYYNRSNPCQDSCKSTTWIHVRSHLELVIQSRQELQEQGNRQRATQPNAKIKQEVRMEKQIYILQLNEREANSEIQTGL